jgi:tetratricopeptide (TPR) repeat protein
LALEHSDRSAEASEALKTGLAHAEKAFGADHAEIAAYLQELGMLHRRHGDHASAQEHFRKALGVHRNLAKVPGAEGVDAKAATEALYNLAASLEESGNLPDAALEYEKMLAMRERQIGANPVETAEAQVRLASLHLQMGRTSSARELVLRAIPIIDRKPGPLLDQARETLKAAEEQARARW